MVDKSLNYEDVTIDLGEFPKFTANLLTSKYFLKKVEGKRKIDGNHIRHAMKHGNAFYEMLMGQLPVDKNDIKTSLEMIKSQKGSIFKIKSNGSNNNASITWELPVNGYTYYVEEILDPTGTSSIEGRTIWKTPTQAKNSAAANSGRGFKSHMSASNNIIRTTSKNINNKKVNVLLTNNTPTKLFISSLNDEITPVRNFTDIYYASIDKKNIKSEKATECYIVSEKPYIVKKENRLFESSDEYGNSKSYEQKKAEIVNAITDIKTNYDSIIMDYHAGDNYSVVVFDKSQIIYKSDEMAQVEENEGKSHSYAEASAEEKTKYRIAGLDVTAGATDKKSFVTKDMDDGERAEILRNTYIHIPEYTEENGVDGEAALQLEKTYKSKAAAIIKGLAEKFGVFKNYSNSDVGLEFYYSKSSYSESIHKQNERNPDFVDFAKMLSVFDDVVSNAAAIECHSDKYVGTKRENPHLNQVYVLLSAFKDAGKIVPLELQIKEFRDGTENKLFVSVTLKK